MSPPTRSNLVLMTTSDTMTLRSYELVRLIASIENARSRYPEGSIRMNLLMQSCTAEDRARLREKLPDWITLFTVPGRVSVSRARNLLLADDAGGRTFEDDDIVAFPDDDCWYPEGLIDRIHYQFTVDKALGFWFCRYAAHPAPCNVRR